MRATQPNDAGEPRSDAMQREPLIGEAPEASTSMQQAMKNEDAALLQSVVVRVVAQR